MRSGHHPISRAYFARSIANVLYERSRSVYAVSPWFHCFATMGRRFLSVAASRTVFVSKGSSNSSPPVHEGGLLQCLHVFTVVLPEGANLFAGFAWCIANVLCGRCKKGLCERDRNGLQSPQVLIVHEGGLLQCLHVFTVVLPEGANLFASFARNIASELCKRG